MKKIIATLLIAVLILCTSCNGGNSDVTFAPKETSYSAGVTSVTGVLTNNSKDKTVSYGNTFTIEYNKDGKWEKVETNPEFYSTEIIIAPNGEQNSSEIIFELKDKKQFESGKYKITLNIKIDDKDSTVSSEFNVK